jgi:integrase
MPKRVPPLTQLQVRNAKPREKAYKLADGGGLYLEVMPAGGKLWRMKYRRPNGAENRLSLGSFPEVSLSDARRQREQARKTIRDGEDPAAPRVAAAAKARTLEEVAREWHRVMSGKWQPQTAQNILHRLECDIFPTCGGLPIDEVKPGQLIEALRAVEGRGALEIAKRNAQNCSRILKYAKRCGYTRQNAAEDLHEVLQPREKGHFAAIETAELPNFLRVMYANDACMGLLTRAAMRLMLHVFVRTSELIETPWDELYDRDTAQWKVNPWVIPWQRMKRGRLRINPDKTDHFVFIPRQLMPILEELHRLTGHGHLVFPNERDPHKPMSNNTILKALERMGYKGDMTGHRFRTLAMSTLKERLGYRHEVVDRQLAHAQKDKLESAYDRAKYMHERREMLQRWADYIDQVAAAALTSAQIS